MSAQKVLGYSICTAIRSVFHLSFHLEHCLTSIKVHHSISQSEREQTGGGFALSLWRWDSSAIFLVLFVKLRCEEPYWIQCRMCENTDQKYKNRKDKGELCLLLVLCGWCGNTSLGWNLASCWNLPVVCVKMQVQSETWLPASSLWMVWKYRSKAKLGLLLVACVWYENTSPGRNFASC